MGDIRFTAEAFAGCITAAVVTIMLPVVLMLLWKKRTHSRDSSLHFLIGAVTFMAFAFILERIAIYALDAALDGSMIEVMADNLWLSGIIGGLFAGVFEECGRFIAFSTVMKKCTDRRSAISYGIGHGGIESMVIAGLSMVQALSIGIALQVGNGNILLSGLDAESAAALTEYISEAASFSFVNGLHTIWERIFAIIIHISFSVLVFAAAKKKKYRLLFPLAIIIHALVDFSVPFMNAEKISRLTGELIVTAFAAALGILAYRIYKTLQEE